MFPTLTLFDPPPFNRLSCLHPPSVQPNSVNQPTTHYSTTSGLSISSLISMQRQVPSSTLPNYVSSPLDLTRTNKIIYTFDSKRKPAPGGVSSFSFLIIVMIILILGVLPACLYFSSLEEQPQIGEFGFVTNYCVYFFCSLPAFSQPLPKP